MLLSNQHETNSTNGINSRVNIYENCINWKNGGTCYSISICT